MKNKYEILPFLLTFYLCISLHSAGFSQPPIVEELNKVIVPLNPDYNTEKIFDLSFLDQCPYDTKIVGLGEATHGTREFFLLKNEITKYLIINRGFKVIVLEASMPGTEILNKYILTGEGDVYRGIVATVYGLYHTDEFLQFVNWLKKYNDTQDVNNKVKIYGCDIFPQTPSRKITEFLKGNNVLSPELEQTLNLTRKFSFQKKYTSKEKRAIRQLPNEISNIFSKLKEEKKIKIDSYNTLQLRILEQFVDINMRYHTQNRDSYMAENCKWIYQQEKENKIVLWAHNEHISKESNVFRYSLGKILGSQYGKDYYTVGFGFNSGEFIALNQLTNNYGKCKVIESDPSSSDYILSKCKYPVFFIDLDNLKNTQVKEYTAKRFYSRSIGGIFNPERFLMNYRKHSLTKSYDILVYFRNTTATTPFVWENIKSHFDL